MPREGIVLVMFDVPGQTKDQRHQYQVFRKNIKKTGYQPVQKSVYVKNIKNISSAGAELQKLADIAPDEGNILALPLSMNRFRSFVAISGECIDFSKYFDSVVCL